MLADNWFGWKETIKFIHKTLKKFFILGIKSNRCVALTRHQAKNGQFQQLNFYSRGKTVMATPSIPVKLLKKIFTNEDGRTGTLYLVMNNGSIDADRLYKVYQKPWKIEAFH